MLTQRQKRFADAVLGGMSPAEAYRLAGYREENASAAARRLLRAPAVQAYMERSESDTTDHTVADSEEILLFLTAVLRGEVGSEKERMRAAELLGKRQGLFSDKVTPEAVTEVVIVDDLGG